MSALTNALSPAPLSPVATAASYRTPRSLTMPRAASSQVAGQLAAATPEALGQALTRAPEVLQRLMNRGPRYTSYPPATAWHEGVGEADLLTALERQAPDAPLSVYVHLPFCPSHCWFCACNVLITQRTDLQDSYLDHVEAEWRNLLPHLPQQRQVRQIHWGGGSPSQLSPAQMRRLMGFLRDHIDLTPDAELAIEVDPRITTTEHLTTLRELGFTRLSMGVQDVDPGVQTLINRVQPHALTAQFMADCRAHGFASVNVDLIYGLPGQTEKTLQRTLEAVQELDPDRLAVYGYAHVPWLKPQQLRMDADRIPQGEQRFVLFQQMLGGLLGMGYDYIGLDHFAKPTDELALARHSGTLQRNFMGYSTFAGTELVGLGLTAIGLVGDTYVQNARKLKTYQSQAASSHLPIERGYVRTADDKLRDAVIQQLLCTGAVDLGATCARYGQDAQDYFAHELLALQPHVADGLVDLQGTQLNLTPLGQILARPVAMVFDAHLEQARAQGARFSAV